MEDLVGKKIEGFEFKSGDGNPSYVSSMRKFVGKIGTIRKCNGALCNIVFDVDPYGFQWQYPTDQVLEHLIYREENVSIDDIILNIKKLTSEL